MTLAIPPVFVEAEAAPLPETAFRSRPVEEIAVGDAIVLHGQMWRVKSRSISRRSPRILFVLHPIAGGRPHVAEFFPRQWQPVARSIR